MSKFFILCFIVFSSAIVFSQESKLPISLEDEAGKTYPVYRGCHKKISYTDVEKCTNRKIRNFFKMSFDLDLADRLFPQDKTAKVLVDFIINKKGKIEKINAKANKRDMAVEAIKVLKRLPKLKKPGTKNGKPIDTDFSMEMTVYF